MAHTYNTKETNSGTSNPVTFSHTPGTASTLLVLGITTDSTTPRAGGAPTFNGKTLTQIAAVQAPGEVSCELWYIAPPDVGGDYTVSMPNTNNDTIRSVVSTYTAGAGKQSWLDVYGSYAGVSANPSITLTTTVDGAAIVDQLANGLDTNPTGQSQTSLFNTDNGTWTSNSQYGLQANAGNITFSYTVASEDKAFIVAAFKEIDAALSKLINDTVTIVESPQFNLPLSTSPYDSTTTIESITSSIVITASPFDTISTTENIATVFDDGNLYKSISDAIIAVENIISNMPLSASNSDTLTVTELVVSEIPLSINNNDSLTVIDTTSQKIPLSANISDLTNITENITKNMPLSITIPRNILLNPSLSDADSNNIADNWPITDYGGGTGATATIVNEGNDIYSQRIAWNNQNERQIQTTGGLNDSDLYTLSVEIYVESWTSGQVALHNSSYNWVYANTSLTGVWQKLETTTNSHSGLLEHSVSPPWGTPVTGTIKIRNPKLERKLESVSVTELVSPEIPLSVAIQEAITTNESIDKSIPLSASIVTLTNIAEAVTASLPLSIILNDTIAIAEWIKAQIPDIEINKYDTLTIAEIIQTSIVRVWFRDKGFAITLKSTVGKVINFKSDVGKVAFLPSSTEKIITFKSTINKTITFL